MSGIASSKELLSATVMFAPESAAGLSGFCLLGFKFFYYYYLMFFVYSIQIECKNSPA